MEQQAVQKILHQPLSKSERNFKLQPIVYMLDDEADKDPILKSAAAKRLFSRGPKFAPTPAAAPTVRLLEDLDRLQFRIFGAAMRAVLAQAPPSKKQRMEEDLGLQTFNLPQPANIKVLRQKLRARRNWMTEHNLHYLTAEAHEVCRTILEAVMRLRNEICLRRRADQNLGAEERRVLEHVKKRGDVRMSVLDKNVGICVYSISKQNEAVSKHLVSSNFRKVEGIDEHNLRAKREEIWKATLKHAGQLFRDLEVPEELSALLLSQVPHLKIQMCKMYVIFKVKAGLTRPIVPAFTTPTALAAQWVHAQVFPFVLKIPTICIDSLRFTFELDKITLPKNFKGRMICLDVIGLYPSIPIDGSLRELQKFLLQNTTLPPGTQAIILKVAEWVMRHNYVEHDGEIFQQVNGLAMGQALCTVIANIFMYKAVEEPVLAMPKWRSSLILFTRYMDDIKALGDLSDNDARELKEDLEAQEPSINFTYEVSTSNAKFLDLQIMMVRRGDNTSIEYRLFRKPGNTMAYLLADSFHPAHTTTGIAKAEFLRILLKSSQRSFYLEDATHLYNAFRDRGYSERMLEQMMRLLDWSCRSYLRSKALTPKAKVVPGGGAVFSPQYDPVIRAYLRLGGGVDLQGIRSISTRGASDEVQRSLGPNLTTVFPKKGAIAPRAAPKLKAVNAASM
jgi:hypothetical protein